jgi:hypothetical protein
MVFELTWFGVFAVIMILTTLFTAGSNFNFSLIIVHHPLVIHGKLNLVMMIVSTGISAFLYLLIVTLLLYKMGIKLNAFLLCLRKIKYRCKDIMSYPISMFNLDDSNDFSRSRNKNKRINILNVEENDDYLDDEMIPELQSEEMNYNFNNKKKNSKGKSRHQSKTLYSMVMKVYAPISVKKRNQ